MLQIDSRETFLIQELQLQNIPHKVEHLEVADMVEGECCIERKTGSDFVMSLCDGRLKTQCQNMLHNYKKSFIIVEGDLPFDFNIHSALGMIASIVSRYSIPIINTKNIYETAYLGWKILEKSNDGKTAEFDVVRKSEWRDKRIDILTLIDGISLEKAKKIIEKYPTFKNLIEAKIEDLKLVDGIGDKLAKNIQNFFLIFKY